MTMGGEPEPAAACHPKDFEDAYAACGAFCNALRETAYLAAGFQSIDKRLVLEDHPETWTTDVLSAYADKVYNLWPETTLPDVLAQNGETLLPPSPISGERLCKAIQDDSVSQTTFLLLQKPMRLSRRRPTLSRTALEQIERLRDDMAALYSDDPKRRAARKTRLLYRIKYAMKRVETSCVGRNDLSKLGQAFDSATHAVPGNRKIKRDTDEEGAARSRHARAESHQGPSSLNGQERDGNAHGQGAG